jgi:cyclopropane-fatty-acyl-phospholipid synthase
VDIGRLHLRSHIQRILEEQECDVVLDGGRPFDPRVHDERLFRRILVAGSLGMGDAYVDGDWDCERLDQLFDRLLRAGVDRRFGKSVSLLGALRAKLQNLQRPSRAGEVGRRHYDAGNDLFEAMLGEPRVYSCAYWRRASTLGEAQEAKLALVCDKLDLKPGMRVLDLGCGFGDAARFVAERHQAEVVGVTVSAEQARAARQRCRGLRVDIRLQDYREVHGCFDRILSLGMFEHVGPRNYRTYMRVARGLLPPDGLALIQTIGTPETASAPDPWIARHIFPNSKLPSAVQICRAAEGLFILEDWHNFGPDYDTTLLHWHRNLEAAWPDLARQYDERFHRMWRYYLLFSAGTFRARYNQLWQIVLSPEGTTRHYRSVR